MNWGNTDTTRMETSHLINCINWINKMWSKERLGVGSNEAIDLLRQSQINCIRAELDFRNGMVDNRLNVEIQHESNEKRYKALVNPVSIADRMIWQSNAKFEDTFGEYPEY